MGEKPRPTRRPGVHVMTSINTAVRGALRYPDCDLVIHGGDVVGDVARAEVLDRVRHAVMDASATPIVIETRDHRYSADRGSLSAAVRTINEENARFRNRRVVPV